jgi:hypothetical protein
LLWARRAIINIALTALLLPQVVGEAVFQAARMAIMDKAPTLLPGVNVNLTCLNSKCVDIPTYNAVYDLAGEGAGAKAEEETCADCWLCYVTIPAVYVMLCYT